MPEPTVTPALVAVGSWAMARFYTGPKQMFWATVLFNLVAIFACGMTVGLLLLSLVF